MKNYYSLLGIAPDAELETIKAAYRQLVHRHHPDRNAQDPAATERFLEIQEAYETLTDENHRLAYDEEFVATFPGYTLDEEEDDLEEWQEDPPASMPVVHDDGSNSLLRILMVLILPLFAGGMVMNFTGDILWTVIATFSALVGAFWIGQYLDN